MSEKETAAPRAVSASETMAALRRQYGCGPVDLTGTAHALYERHLLFDNVADPAVADARERYEALARSVRDVLSQRWVRTEQTYERANPKRVYYLSMEFLIGRSLTNNITNLLLSPFVSEAVKQESLDWLGLLEEEPDAGLGNGGLGRLAACFLDSMATMQLPAMGYGLRYEYGMFRQSIEAGWQHEQSDNWLRRPDPWEVVRPEEKVEIRMNHSIEVRDGTLRAVPGRPFTLLGIPYDRPVVGYGGKTINTLRLWAAAASDEFDFQTFSHGEFVSALAKSLAAKSLTRVLYPDDSTTQGQELRFVQEYFLVACSLADLIRRFRRSNSDWSALPERVAIQLNDTHPALAVPELMRILLDEAHLGWDQAWDLTQRTLAYTNHTLLPEALEKWPLEWFEILLPRHLEIVLEINRRLLDAVRDRFPGEERRVARTSLIEEGSSKHVRMANVAIVGSHSTNGVAAIHSALLRSTSGQTVDPDTIFDSQVKRIHEYKRQLLNALRIIVLYNRLRENPKLEMTPRTFLFAGKAAPAYHLAKLIIKFLNNLAETIDADPMTRGRLKVLFLPEYNVSLAERLIPATDVSNQISTAGYEASGTSNMKFMMSGALTIGTRDGATIEMAHEAGEENFFLFGLTAEQVAGSRGWYNPRWHYDHQPETRAALDLIFSDHFSRNEPGIFAPLHDTLLTRGDYYMHLADLKSYLEADQRLCELYADSDEWAHKSILNVASSGKFSSDHTIAEYATQIWEVKPCPVP